MPTPSPTAELCAAAIAYVDRQSNAFSAETWRAWNRLENAVEAFKAGDRAGELAEEIAVEGIRKCVPSRPAGRE